MTRDEIVDTGLVAITMGGGLAYTESVYMLEALETWGAGREVSDAKAEEWPRPAKARGKRVWGDFGFAALVELELGAGPGIGSADCCGSNRSLHRMRTVRVSVPRGGYLSELGGQGGRGRIVVPRVWRLRGRMPSRRGADERSGTLAPTLMEEE